MRIALVGVGGMGSVHFGIYKEMKDIELVALCDVRMDMLKEKAGDLPVKLYADMYEMLAAEKPDMVDLCTPTYMHVEQAIKCMEAGAHVLSEKPMGLTGEETEVLLEAIKRTGKRYMTAQVVRFMNAYVYLRGVIESGKYGKLESLAMRRFSQAPLWSWENWFQDDERSGGVILDMHVHDVDFISWAFGKPASVTTKSVQHLMHLDTAVTNYDYDDKLIVSTTSWGMADQFPFTAEYIVNFEKATIVYKDGKTVIYTNDTTEEVSLEKENFDQPSVNGYVSEVIDFINCIRNDCESKINTTETAKLSLEIAFAEKKSATTKETVML